MLVFTEEFPSIPDFDLSVVDVNSRSGSEHAFKNIVAKFQSNVSSLLSAQTIDHLMQNAGDLRSLLSEEVDYGEVERTLKEQGTTDDEEIQEALKKAYGSELFKRQRAFADLKKLASTYGINFRKGLQMDTEELNELAMTGSHEPINDKVIFLCIKYLM